jgi:hypothetical protein
MKVLVQNKTFMKNTTFFCHTELVPNLALFSHWLSVVSFYEYILKLWLSENIIFIILLELLGDRIRGKNHSKTSD